MPESLSNTVISLQTVRLATLLKRDPGTGVSEPPILDYKIGILDRDPFCYFTLLAQIGV